ncbi:MAG TPA: hypothetical protein VIQ30_24345 [Pseudonocardia sp.]
MNPRSGLARLLDRRKDQQEIKRLRAELKWATEQGDLARQGLDHWRTRYFELEQEMEAEISKLRRAPVPAPITAEDVRAAERAWNALPTMDVAFDLQLDPSAFIADHLNHARDHALDPGPGRDETTEGNG